MLRQLEKVFSGELFSDDTTRTIYATDASLYSEKPKGVAIPKNETDLKLLIDFANQNKIGLIPRTAGTSLAGQVVGNGIVVDLSKYFRSIIAIDTENQWVDVEPGVVLDELNAKLKMHSLFFAPETSTSSRCMLGGMVGNNSCGAHSVVYGSMRDHLIEVDALLSDGTKVTFSDLTKEEFKRKLELKSLEGELYRNIFNLLSNEINAQQIIAEYPAKSLKRRNTGYAIDILLDTCIFGNSDKLFNFCSLIAGSEGTLAIATRIRLNIMPLPPPITGLVAAHFDSIDDALRANIIALKYLPEAIELMDNVLIECTKSNKAQNKNRFFIKGDPKAILLIEFSRYARDEISATVEKMKIELRENGFGYHFPLMFDADIQKVWALRKAGLGLLANIAGDKKSVTVIEDTAIDVNVLPEYASEFSAILNRMDLSCVFYAHVGSGELHLRPILDLRDKTDLKKFETIAFEIAKLVKKYKGSLSGEHGDGRLRGRFIPLMIGDNNYSLLLSIKETWDKNRIFNPNKITETPQITANLRTQIGMPIREINTFFDFEKTNGFVRAVEKCNGSADCRRSNEMAGNMCPTYRATLDEHQTTRARANLLRDFLNNPKIDNPLSNKDIYDLLSTCLSCKACKTECPANVDMAKLKAEFLQHFYDHNGTPFRTKLISNISAIYWLFAHIPSVFNFFARFKFVNKLMGISTSREMPILAKRTFRQLFAKNSVINPRGRKVYIFCDEFTNHIDAEIGMKVVLLLQQLGYNPTILKSGESGRASLSKGLLRKARKIAENNIIQLEKQCTDDFAIIGIEPSATLSFRDEYPELVSAKFKETAEKFSNRVLLIDEFLSQEFKKNNISSAQFTTVEKRVFFHTHCQQKALVSGDCTQVILSIPVNYNATEIESGCCGMAGAFGYEAKNYELSMKIGELKLFPAVRKMSDNELLAAAGTSCRHQIFDGTGRRAQHPVEILFDALPK